MVPSRNSTTAIIVAMLVIFCVGALGAMPPPHASMSPAQLKPTHTIFGTLPCSEETPCPRGLSLSLTYDATVVGDFQDENVLPSVQSASFYITIHLNNTRQTISTSPMYKLTQGTGDQSHFWRSETITPLKATTLDFQSPLRYTITFQRQITNPAPMQTSMALNWSEEFGTGSVQLYDVKNDHLGFAGSAPSAHMTIGPIELPEEAGSTPYDNSISLDFDLSWFKWDEVDFDQITIHPIGNAIVNPEEYSQNCLFGGQYLPRVLVVTDEDDDSYHKLTMRGIKDVLHRNGAAFSGPNQLQLQCSFPVPSGLREQKFYFTATDISFLVEFVTDEKNPLKNNVIWFAPTNKQALMDSTTQSQSDLKLNQNQHQYNQTDLDLEPQLQLQPSTSFPSRLIGPVDPDPKTTSFLTMVHIAPRSYVSLIGNTPSLAIQSRFNRILKQGEHLSSKPARYVSYYSVAFPVEMPNTLHGQQWIVNQFEHFETTTVLLTGQEMLQTDSLDSAQVYLRCIKATPHFTLLRSQTVLSGRFSPKSKSSTGPGKNQVSITSPVVQLNPEFVWPATEKEFQQRHPCDIWSYEVNFAVYNEDIDEDMLNNSEKYAFGVRLRHSVQNHTGTLIRHDWISSYDVNSQESDAVPNDTNRFKLTKVTEHKPAKGSKNPLYWSFEMLVDTTGIKKTGEEGPDTMPFYLNPIGGPWEFYLPLKGDDFQGEISCTVSAPNLPAHKITASIITDNNISFDWIDAEQGSEGIPFNTKDIKIVCENVRIKGIGNKPLNQYETNIALRLPVDTFTVALFGKYYDPVHDANHSGRSPAAKFGIFLLVLVIIAVVVAAVLGAIEFVTDGKVSYHYNLTVRPFFARLFSRGDSSRPQEFVSAENDEGAGAYGSYANSTVN